MINKLVAALEETQRWTERKKALAIMGEMTHQDDEEDESYRKDSIARAILSSYADYSIRECFVLDGREISKEEADELCYRTDIYTITQYDWFVFVIPILLTSDEPEVNAKHFADACRYARGHRDKVQNIRIIHSANNTRIAETLAAVTRVEYKSIRVACMVQ